MKLDAEDGRSDVLTEVPRVHGPAKDRAYFTVDLIPSADELC
jgi:hypothetical protein